jgi:long-chain acyl-CoA synthetase
MMPDPSEIERPWLDAYPPGVPPTYAYPDVTLPRFLDDAARDFPNALATRYDGAGLDYVELRRLVDETASGLAGLGVEPGTRVATLLPNLPVTVAVAFATWRLGAVLVPLDPRLPSLEIERVLDDSAAQVAVTLPDVATTLAGLALPALRTVVVTHPRAWRQVGRLARLARRLPLAGDRPRLPPGADFESVVFADVLAAGTRPQPRHLGEPGDVAVIAYTGGTTGQRKGVVLTHTNLVASAFQARLWIPDVQAGRERVLAATPFSHLFGLTLGMLTAVLSAATLVLPDAPDGRSLVATIVAERPTMFPAVPALLRAVTEAPEAVRADLTSLRACMSGAAPLPPDIASRFVDLTGQARVRECYGLSEAGPLTHANPIYGRAEVGRIGLPVTDTVAIVVDPDDPARRLPPGQAGELAIHGPQIMAGYHGDPDATDTVVHDGWILTGDIVVVDEAGSFALVDRKKEVIVTDVAAVFPREVEEVLIHHPAVDDAVVAGRPRPDGAAEITAAVVLRPGARVRAEQLASHCEHHLPPHAVPAQIDIRDTLPTGSLGKVSRHRLVAELDGQSDAPIQDAATGRADDRPHDPDLARDETHLR